MEPLGPWRPLAEGALAADVRAALADVADALVEDPALDPRHRGTLAYGEPGIAVLFAYLDAAFPGRGHGDRARRLLERAVQVARETRPGGSLYAGLSGVGWAIAQARAFAGTAGEHPNAALDAALRDRLRRTPWRGDFDLVSGLVGYGVYALERLPDPVAVDCLGLVVERLSELAEETPDGVAWRSPPASVPPAERGDAPDGSWNLGMAHGVPGVVALLAGAAAAGVAESTSRALLGGAVDWVLAQELEPAGDASRFPCSLPPRRGPARARTAWCYGEPGIAAALLLAARAAESRDWAAAALAIARRAARRRRDDTGVVDAGLCHGAAGLAQVFARLAHATGDEELAEAARGWLAEALAMREPEGALGGFTALSPRPGGGWERVPEAGLLTGAAGVGLVLLAATTDLEPDWDRFLLLSLPPRSRRAGARAGYSCDTSSRNAGRNPSRS